MKKLKDIDYINKNDSFHSMGLINCDGCSYDDFAKKNIAFRKSKGMLVW